ncbi:hypothetical protein F9K97_02165 [Brucella anthropi]|uniref:hypothetical protein n=1 Tax=Brucella anthropi TaxID=529 RepID=UPI00124C3269|nr:hypothetical protein [Brucella anthropi]KAB2780483.1 hypothetical protein F9L00_07845 [Brucella anthropi]KAB2789365.1 hypothetical protein F9K97_02165 [Brucella anthropi]
MRSGTCKILIDGTDAGEAEYKYNLNGRGEVWLAPDILMDAFAADSVVLQLPQGDLEIIITSATPGEAAPFAFKEWRNSA